jgi:prefoldin subunit 5
MKDSIKNLSSEREKLVDKLDLVNSGITSLQNLYYLKNNGDDIPASVVETINLLKNEYTTLKNQIKGYSNAINDLQSVCEHKNLDGSDAMKYSGRDSHKSYYECSICGYENDY